jgi:hypothetical protein
MNARTKAPLCAIAGLLLAGSLSAALAAPNVPMGDRPGRDRQRFLETAPERYMHPTQETEPLIEWCDPNKRRGKKPPPKRGGRGC